MIILETRKVGRIAGNSHGKIKIVDSISYSFDAGSIYNIVGPSGAGKTSFLRLLNRLDEATEGEIFFRGKLISSYQPTELRKKIAMIFQIPFLFPGSVRENLEYCCKGHRKQKDGHDYSALLERVGLKREFINKNSNDLSVGEKQRVALARSLLLEPEILLLDEPTSALDPSMAQIIEQLILSLSQELGLTAIIVTHNPELAKRMEGQTLLMVAGKLIEHGATDKVLNTPQTELGLKYINKELV
jgi:putative ABC transport system ATP-binding protein